MRILALDLGTRTGWALWNGTRRESGVQTFDVKRGESPGMRYIRFNRWFSNMIGQNTPAVEVVVYEQTHNRGGAATEVSAGFATRVQEACAALGINHAAIHSATLKKFATGRGRCDKADVISAVNERFGPPFVSDDNEADAIALLEYTRAEMFGDHALSHAV